VLHLALVHTPTDVGTAAYPMAEALDAHLAEDRAREEAYLEALAARLAPTDLAVRPALLRGHVADTLARHVEDHEVDVVVMTTHGRGGLQRAWLGSTTDSLLRQCRVPLLLIRPCDETREIGPESERLFHRVLAGLDGSDTAERALGEALRLGSTADATVVLLHVMSPSVAAVAPYLPHTVQLTHDEMAAREAYHRGYLEGVSRCDSMSGRTVETRVVVDYDPAPAILDVAEEVDADLIVLGTHGRGGLRRMVLGSVADKVIRGTSRAVLVERGTGRLARLGGKVPRPDAGTEPVDEPART
jgi:nucleotide-binding universal stress UspA family protein